MTEKSWPFQEARSLLSHIERKGKKPGDLVTFETGYGPSGAPHIGTFGEVVRTLMVMDAFRALTEDAYELRLIIFSDDYDGFRSVPDQLPPEWKQYLGRPLSQVPDPHYNHMSFAQVNNSTLIHFVNDILESRDPDAFVRKPDDENESLEAKIQEGMMSVDNGRTYSSEEVFDRIKRRRANPPRTNYHFRSAAQMYRSGLFDPQLKLVWDNYQAILDIMLPTLGADRQATYSPFMPIGVGMQVLQEGVTLYQDRPMIRYYDPGLGEDVIAGVCGGNTKLQWKVDWAMRWVHFDVDYEMHGKDLTDSYRDSSAVCKVLGGTPPLNMIYELFLDENGKKISKKLGNGVTLEEWHRYGSSDALAYYMFQSPKSAKKLTTKVIPKVTDELANFASRFTGVERDNPMWHIQGRGSRVKLDVTYGLMLNLAQVSKAEDSAVLLEYLEQYRPIPADQRPIIEQMAKHVVNYANHHGLLDRKTRDPSEQEARAMLDLACRFTAMMPRQDAEKFQFQVYEVGKTHGFDPLRSWFQALYEVLLGEESGPRFGAFTTAYGVERTIGLLVEAASRVVDVSGFNAIVAHQQE